MVAKLNTVEQTQDIQNKRENIRTIIKQQRKKQLD